MWLGLAAIYELRDDCLDLNPEFHHLNTRDWAACIWLIALAPPIVSSDFLYPPTRSTRLPVPSYSLNEVGAMCLSYIVCINLSPISEVSVSSKHELCLFSSTCVRVCPLASIGRRLAPPTFFDSANEEESLAIILSVLLRNLSTVQCQTFLLSVLIIYGLKIYQVSFNKVLLYMGNMQVMRYTV